MRQMKRSLCWLLTLVTLLSMMSAWSFSAAADTAAGSPVSQTYDDGKITWTYDPASQILTFRPTVSTQTHALKDLKETDVAPWDTYASSVRIIIFENGITAVGAYNFDNMPNLVAVSFPETLLSIYSYAFAGASKITQLDFPTYLREIWGYAFSGCTGLTKATAKNPFMTCHSEGQALLYSLLQGKTPGGGDDNQGGGNEGGGNEGGGNEGGGNEGGGNEGGGNEGGGTTPPPATTYQAIGETALEWYYSTITKTLHIRVKANAPEDASRAIPDYTSANPAPWMAHIPEMTGLELGSGITAVGTNAFKSALRLTSVNIPASITSLGVGSFADCTALKTVYLQNTMNPIPKGTFAGSTAISTVDFEGYRSQWDVIAPAGVADDEIARNLVGKLKCYVTWIFIYEYPNSTTPLHKTLSGKTGEPVNITHQEFDNYVPHGPLTLTYVFGIEDMLNIHITYVPVTYQVTLQFKDAATGEKLMEDQTVSVAHGTPYIYTPPAIAYYDSVLPEVVITTTSNTTVEVFYRAKTYSYKIVYVNSRTQEVIDEKMIAGLTALTPVKPDALALEIPTHYTFASFAWADGTDDEILIKDNSHVLTVMCTPDSKNVTIQYVDDLGNPIPGAPSQTFTIYYSEDTTLTTFATLPGHIAPTEIVIKAEDFDNIQTTYAVPQERKTYTFTVKFHNAELDNQLYIPYTVTLRYGDAFTFKLSEFAQYAVPAGYKTDVEEIKIDSLNEETALEQTITYSLKKYDVIINFYKDSAEGEGAYESLTLSQIVTHGQAFEYTLDLATYPAPEGYEISILKYNLNNVQEDGREIDIIYTRKQYKVTIEFIESDAFGREIFTAYEVTIPHGETYTFRLSEHADKQTLYYTTDLDVVVVSEVTGDVTKQITYTRKALTLTVLYMDGETLIKQLEIPTKAAETVLLTSLTLDGYLPTIQDEIHMDYESKEIRVMLQVDPNADKGDGDENPDEGNQDDENQAPSTGDNEKDGGSLKTILLIIIILLVLIIGGMIFYFLYSRKKTDYN